MKQLEENVLHSFKLAKRDIMKLHNNFLKLSQTQERMMEMLKELKSNELKIYKSLKEVNSCSSAKINDLMAKKYSGQDTELIKVVHKII